MSARDDEALLREFCSGSDAAFRELAQRYGAIVYASCLRTLHRPELAEDAAQAVFLVLAQKAQRIRIRTTLIPWLLTTSRVVCRHHARAEGRRRKYEQSLDEDVVAATDGSDNSLFEALEKLRDPEREAIVLRFVQGLSLGEVGELQGISEDAARMRVKRAISRLKRTFVASVAPSPTLFSRLANPKTAPASVQRLAQESTTMFTTHSIAGYAVAGLTGIGAIGVVSLYRVHPLSTPAPNPSSVTRPLSPSAPVAKSKPGKSPYFMVPSMRGPFTLKYRLIPGNAPHSDLTVTISSEGDNLLVFEEDASSGAPVINTVTLNSGHHTHLLIPSNTPGVHTNMWVTLNIAIPPPLSFVGVDFPTLPPRLELTGAGKLAGNLWQQPANFSLMGGPPEVPFEQGLCFVEDLSKGVKVLNSFVIGAGSKFPDTWKFGGYRAFNGTYIASTIQETLVQPSFTNRTEFELKSAKPTALAHELFSPEHYLQDGDNVEYKIPMQAKMNLLFTYHQNGLSIEDQAHNQDALEVQIHPIHP